MRIYYGLTILILHITLNIKYKL